MEISLPIITFETLTLDIFHALLSEGPMWFLNSPEIVFGEGALGLPG